MDSWNKPVSCFITFKKDAVSLYVGVTRLKKPLVSLIIPTYNSSKFLPSVLDAIQAQNYSKSRTEIIIIDDNSTDSSIRISKQYKSKLKGLFRFKIYVKDPKFPKGAAKSTNIGFRMAKGDIICSIDSDAIIDKNWITEIVKTFSDPKIGSSAGYIRTANKDNFWASIAGLELEDRYLRIKTSYVNHVSTCNTAYRASLMKKLNGFDESMYYGYDVDMSYRITNEGYKIRMLKRIGCDHYWKESFKSYMKQQFNVAYGRMAIIATHTGRYMGDHVSGGNLILQVPLTILGVLFLFLYPPVGLILLIVLLLYQVPQTIRIIKRVKKLRYLSIPFILLLRNLVWGYAFLRFVIAHPIRTMKMIIR